MLKLPVPLKQSHSFLCLRGQRSSEWSIITLNHGMICWPDSKQSGCLTARLFLTVFLINIITPYYLLTPVQTRTHTYKHTERHTCTNTHRHMQIQTHTHTVTAYLAASRRHGRVLWWSSCSSGSGSGLCEFPHTVKTHAGWWMCLMGL